ncbi:NitT/TauT family transport system permease protein [Actinoplanes campanulatus]|uniref:NitT/TauT family transport system permease protein n=1 Tax=Actinoplanes campanulatus TaxID=113559 RepID=A0A7W5ACE1_9ACTN|nr:ABC transporter permease [Actinoplanes campanulatus]MBB3093450.1 NitT/TauT family transport system permease protein [Actinoplanes campanulatus]GGN50238.1 sulfate ABC transporter permease [Actinoplanes campanulatus]GID42433.1 sulfate ABC transporter permease [Actinoplanes campanulatus]
MPTEVVTADKTADEVSGLDALELAPRPEKGDRGRRIWNSAWPKLLAVAIAIAAWQLVVLSEWKPTYVLPGPVDVFADLKELATTPDFWDGVRLTLTRAFTGFLLAVAIGTVIGAAVSRFAPLRAAIGSLITGLQTMPSIMWFPLAILLFQLSESAIMFVVVIGAAPSVANGLISGIDYVPRTWLRVGQVLGMKGLSKYRHLILPASLPSFISGLKQGWAFSWRSLMAGELLVIVPGALSVGARMQNARDLHEASLVISYIIVVLIIGILIDILFNTADNALRKRWGLTGN